MIKLKDYNVKISIPTISDGLDNRNWFIIKQIIYSELNDTNIKLFISNKQNIGIPNN